MSMTNDDLIQFAAEKVGVEINRLATWGISFEGENVWATWDLGKGESLTPFDLDSLELFGRGVMMCPYEVVVEKFFRVQTYPQSLRVAIMGRNRMILETEPYETPHDIPKSFWRCWYRLEHDEI